MQVEATMREGSMEIPHVIREVLQLRDGDTLVFDTDDDGVHLRVRHRADRGSFREVVGIFGNASEGKSIEQIVADERAERCY